MNKLLLVLLPVSFAATNVSAQCCYPHYLNGFYLGLSGGVLHSFSHVTTNTSVEELGFGITNSIPSTDSQLGENHGIGSFYIGFGHQINQTPLYLGAEIYGAVGNKSNSVTNNAFSESSSGGDLDDPVIDTVTSQLSTTVTSQLQNFEYGFDLKPGLIVNQGTTLLYGRAGAAFNHLKLISSSTRTAINELTSATTIGTLNTENEQSVVGLRLGIGIEQTLPCNFALTADFIYTQFGDEINTSGSTNATPGELSSQLLNNSTECNMNTQTVLFGLKYYFDKI